MVVPLRTNCPGQTGHIDDASAERGADGASIEPGPRQLDAGLGRLDLGRPGRVPVLRSGLLLLELGRGDPQPGVRLGRVELDEVLGLADHDPEPGIHAPDQPVDGGDELHATDGSRTAVTW